MRKISPALSLAFGLAAAAVMPGQTRAATLTTLVSFNNTDGEGPSGGVITDSVGNLFGTTFGGGAYDHGTVFQIAKTAAGYASTPTVLYSFCPPFAPGPTCGDGAFPQAGLLADATGDLFGTTEQGGAFGLTTNGTVFELAKTTVGYASTPTTLVSFNGANGTGPVGSLVADPKGNLFGATGGGGTCGDCGTVFEIAKTTAGYASTPTTLVSFNGTDGMNPNSGVIIDSRGNLFGTTQGGGANSGGTVFEIVKTATGYASTPTILYSFCAMPGCTDGRTPNGVIADTRGNLFGTTADGGACDVCGTAFEIVKTRRGYADTPTILYSFCAQAGCADGEGPGNLILDASRNLFGTTSEGGTSGNGTVFKIAKSHRGYARTPTILANFTLADGQRPFGGLTADAAGNLFGTAAGGGSHNFGTVFEITGSGFVPPAIFAGTPGTPRCIGRSVAGLARQYGGLLHAAAALDYASVRNLLNAIGAYCAV